MPGWQQNRLPLPQQLRIAVLVLMSGLAILTGAVDTTPPVAVAQDVTGALWW